MQSNFTKKKKGKSSKKITKKIMGYLQFRGKRG